jgi:hypothetical protein
MHAGRSEQKVNLHDLDSARGFLGLPIWRLEKAQVQTVQKKEDSPGSTLTFFLYTCSIRFHLQKCFLS